MDLQFYFNKSKRLIMKSTLIVLLSAYAFAGSISLDKKIKITSSSKVEMYTALFWVPCNEAKTLLKSRGIEFETHLITLSRKNVAQMARRTNGKTYVPQIMVDDHYFGGLAELIVYFKDKPNTE